MRLLLVTRCGCTRRVDMLLEDGARPPTIYSAPLALPQVIYDPDKVAERYEPVQIREFALESRVPTAPYGVPTYLYREIPRD